MDKTWVIATAGALVIAGVVIFSVVNDTPEDRNKAVPLSPNAELMTRMVTTPEQLRKEIDDMTQTTAELRKVLRDMERVLRPERPSPSGGSQVYGNEIHDNLLLQMPPKPQCTDEETSVMIELPANIAEWHCARKDAIR